MASKLRYDHARALSVLLFAMALLFPAKGQTPGSARLRYQARCAGCHGDDGTGGGHGPNIVDLSKPRGNSKNAIREIILRGIPEGGMPAFQITTTEADSIAAYVMSLKTPSTTILGVHSPALGDPAAGERFFSGSGN